MTTPKIGCIFGTRPELIKMAPVIHSLLKVSSKIETEVICSGQHRDLLHPLINWFDLKVDLNFDVMSKNQNLNTLSSRMIEAFGELFERQRYSCIVAQGDTTTVLMSALAAFHSKIPFAHVEAGLRTHDMNLPFPEEMNRTLVGKVASLHFAPTQTSADNLLRESIRPDSISITGNTVIDALQFTTQKLAATASPLESRKMLLVTAHRRDNFGEPLIRICKALLKIARKNPELLIVFPVHPNPNVRHSVHSILSAQENIRLLEPLPYNELVGLLAQCYFVISDSGGLQEEAPALKKPILVLREETERPEVVDLGGAELVGTDETLIYERTQALLTDEKLYQQMVIGYSPYGTGKSAEAITSKLLGFIHQC